MRPGRPFQVATVKLMQSLKRDFATLLSAQLRGDFLPRLALPPLLTNEVNIRFQPTAISPTAALPAIFGFRIH
jgi:hypothetical protein